MDHNEKEKMLFSDLMLFKNYNLAPEYTIYIGPYVNAAQFIRCVNVIFE